MTTVTAPSRLHFGLLHLPREGLTHWPGVDGEPGLPVRNFGGVGLMIDRPGVRVSVERSDEWEVTGPLAHRALDFAKKFTASLDADRLAAFRVRVLDCPEEHTGLGVGTSLALSVAKGVAVETGHVEWDSVELAKRVGRGERSAIGVHGFQHGGLIVEAGKLPGESVSPLVGRYYFPEEWRILLCRPRVTGSWSAPRERLAFAALARSDQVETNALCRIVMTSLIPSLQARDLDQFSRALFEFNYRVGLAFAPAQGGGFSHPEVEEVIRRLQEGGIAGVGQSSWGPTVFGIVPETFSETSIRRCVGEHSEMIFARGTGGATYDRLPGRNP